MRVLSAMGFVDEVDYETYAANDLTNLMAEDVTDGVVKMRYVLFAGGHFDVVLHRQLICPPFPLATTCPPECRW